MAIIESGVDGRRRGRRFLTDPDTSPRAVSAARIAPRLFPGFWAAIFKADKAKRGRRCGSTHLATPSKSL